MGGWKARELSNSSVTLCGALHSPPVAAHRFVAALRVAILGGAELRHRPTWTLC
jgi:hypothetical protein